MKFYNGEKFLMGLCCDRSYENAYKIWRS